MLLFFLISALVTARLLAEVLFLTVQGPGFCHVFYHTSVPRAAVIFLAVCLYLCPSSKRSVQNNLLDLVKKKKGHRINFSACSMVEMVFVNGDFCSMTYILKATICHLFFSRACLIAIFLPWICKYMVFFCGTNVVNVLLLSYYALLWDVLN